uniref:Uncharacterized protein n=1 Tax=Ditylenchus dipsaci TaxID=166011 RepID=A0A915CTX4_9BILA
MHREQQEMPFILPAIPIVPLASNNLRGSMEQESGTPPPRSIDWAREPESTSLPLSERLTEQPAELAENIFTIDGNDSAAAEAGLCQPLEHSDTTTSEGKKSEESFEQLREYSPPLEQSSSETGSNSTPSSHDALSPASPTPVQEKDIFFATPTTQTLGLQSPERTQPLMPLAN